MNPFLVQNDNSVVCFHTIICSFIILAPFISFQRLSYWNESGCIALSFQRKIVWCKFYEKANSAISMEQFKDCVSSYKESWKRFLQMDGSFVRYILVMNRHMERMSQDDWKKRISSCFFLLFKQQVLQQCYEVLYINQWTVI